MPRKAYSTDLSDAQLALILTFFQPKSTEGRPREANWRGDFQGSFPISADARDDIPGSSARNGAPIANTPVNHTSEPNQPVE